MPKNLLFIEKNMNVILRRLFFLFSSSCRHPPVTFELRGGYCIASSCLFFVEAPIPRTHCRLSRHLMPSSPFILFYYFFQVLGSSPYWQSELAVSACRRLSVFCPKSGRGQWRDVETGGEAREKWRKRIQCGEAMTKNGTISHHVLFVLLLFLSRETIICWH